MVGDWKTLVPPVMRDPCTAGSQWWDAVMGSVFEEYQQWLRVRQAADC